MTDILERIRSLRYVHVPVASGLMEEAAAEIEQLREAIRRLFDQAATLSVKNGNVMVTLDATLSDAEREAIEWCLSLPILDRDAVRMIPLRSLLERMK
jgi:hypothetical protein